MKIYRDIFEKIISPENLFSAWRKFKSDKGKKEDVLRFEWKLEENIFQLYRDLKYQRYQHGSYSSFYIQDPKQRHIHKAVVRDRVLHHAVFAVLNPIFEPSFISHSFSCRIGKGTHRGVNALEQGMRAVSHNASRPCYVLKCDIKKFFQSVHHDILIGILKRRIKDEKVMRLLREIIGSFSSSYSTLFERRGLPIGNLTSQMFANIYLNELDQFVKQGLRIKHYARYTDDFVIASEDKRYVQNLIVPIRSFLNVNLALELHPKKVGIHKYHRGVDFLGYIVRTHHRLLRTKTRQRMYRRLREHITAYKSGKVSKETLEQSLSSYLGVLSHADAYELGEDLKNQYWFHLTD